MSQSDSFWPLVAPSCAEATRVLVFEHVQDDTYMIHEDGGAYLSDKATLTMLLKRLREGQSL